MKAHKSKPLLANSRYLRAPQGFTLLEILVVISILAAISAIAAPLLSSVDDAAGIELTNVELKRLETAIRRFKKDTGYYPKQGPFSGGNLTAAMSDGTDKTDIQALINHPANWSQLFHQPVTYTAAGEEEGDAVWEWDADVSRGWRGPYLSDFAEGEVTVGLDLGVDGTSGPYGGDLIMVPSVADPYGKLPSGNYMVWNGEAELTRGRPFLLFIESGAETNVAGCHVPCILSMGKNADYDAGSADDLLISLGGG